jgi:hypothetical protein
LIDILDLLRQLRYQLGRVLTFVVLKVKFVEKVGYEDEEWKDQGKVDET